MRLNLSKKEAVYLSGLLVGQDDESADSISAKLGRLIKKHLQPYHCEVCQTPIVTVDNHKNRQYCSNKCRQSAYRQREYDRKRAIGTQKVAANL